jgi:hypothetical protein
MDLIPYKFHFIIGKFFSQKKNKLSDGHGNIVFEPVGHRQKYGNEGFCVNKQTPEPQFTL